MQETRYDGSQTLTEQAAMEDFEKAWADERNASVALHKPGATFTDRKGRSFQVQQDGKIKRRAKNKQARRARRRNRQ